jgi:hypothetical protein
MAQQGDYIDPVVRSFRTVGGELGLSEGLAPRRQAAPSPSSNARQGAGRGRFPEDVTARRSAGVGPVDRPLLPAAGGGR